MATARAIIVHDLAQAEAALAVAAELSVPITLMSPPGAAAYQGVGYFAAMVEEARRAVPTAVATAVLDCGDAPGLALAALRHGIDAVRIEAPAKIRARIADIAKQTGGALVTGRVAALDLATAREPREACRAWLGKPARGRRG
jgi:hypothetical protein